MCKPLSDPAVSTAGKEPTRGLRVHYCYSSALQNGGEYAELYTCQYSIWSYTHRGKGSIKNRRDSCAAKPGWPRNASSHTHIRGDESCELV